LLRTNKKDFWSKITLLVVGIIFIYGMYLRLKGLTPNSLWNDELNQLKVMKGSFFDLLINLPKNELNSYLNLDHFLIYPFFKFFSYNKIGLAIPHIIAAIFTFYFLFLNCKRLFKTNFAYVIVFWIFSVNTTLIRHAVEIRPYAVLPGLALAVFYFTELLANNINMTSKKKNAIYIFLFVAICFHTYGIFIVFVCYAFSVLSRWKKDFIKMFFTRNIKRLLSMLAIALPYWFYNVLGPLHIDVSVSNYDPFVFIPSPVTNSIGFLKGVFGTLVGFRLNYLFLPILLVPFILPYKERFKQIIFFFVLILLSVFLVLVGDLIGGYWFMQRQFIWVMPFFALLLGWIIDSLIFFVLKKGETA